MRKCTGWYTIGTIQDKMAGHRTVQGKGSNRHELLYIVVIAANAGSTEALSLHLRITLYYASTPLFIVTQKSNVDVSDHCKNVGK